jgi:hypothetical protein
MLQRHISDQFWNDDHLVAKLIQINTVIVSYCEQIPAGGPCQYCEMVKRNKYKESAKATIASVKREMEKPRLTESVRNDRSYQAALLAEQLLSAPRVS